MIILLGIFILFFIYVFPETKTEEEKGELEQAGQTGKPLLTKWRMAVIVIVGAVSLEIFSYRPSSSPSQDLSQFRSLMNQSRIAQYRSWKNEMDAARESQDFSKITKLMYDVNEKNLSAEEYRRLRAEERR